MSDQEPLDVDARGWKPVAMLVTVNGEAREMKVGATVADLISDLGLSSVRVAVEVNRTLVRRAEHPATRLRAADRVEVVTLVGGG